MAPTLRRWSWGEDPAALGRVLVAGGVLAIPCESSYGLAADPRSSRGVAAIYALKGRAPRKPLPVVGGDLDQLLVLGLCADDPGLERAAGLWPAPLTAVVPLRPSAALPASAAAGSLGVRVPASPRLRRLLGELGTALTATSANREGRPPIREPADLEPLFAGRAVEAVVVDGGRLAGGAPSTVVAWRDGALRILRPGAFPAERLGSPATATAAAALP